MKNEHTWVRLLAYVTGLVNKELLTQNEYLAAENLILRAHLPTRLRLSDPERATLAEIGKRVGRKALAQIACVAKPDTILAWYRRLIAVKFDGSKHRSYPGRPRQFGNGGADPAIRPREPKLGLRPDRGSTGQRGKRCVGPDSRQRSPSARDRAAKRTQTTTWKDFIQSHMAVLAGADFFTVEVLTWRGLATFYVLFFIQLETRRVTLGGVTRHPTAAWMEQMAHNATDQDGGFGAIKYLLHDRDAKFCAAFDSLLKAGGVDALRLPARSPNLNAFAERWVRSAKEECLSRLILFGEVSLKRTLTEFIAHYHSERPHQAKGNVLLFPGAGGIKCPTGQLVCKERLGGLLKYYARAA